MSSRPKGPGSTIRATVSPDSVERVSSFFDASLTEMLAELFQNSRRAGATRIDVDATPAGRLRIRDDGAGIAEPRVLLCLGESGWPEAVRRREDPDGMGLAVLARTRSRITSRPESGPGWSVSLDERHWNGDRPADVEPLADEGREPRGTTIEIETAGVRSYWPAPESADDEVLRRWAAGAVEEAARYLPVAVRCRGTRCAQEGFLDGSEWAGSWRGVEIGVSRRWRTVPRNGAIAFYGRVITDRPLPTVTDLRGATWSARVNVIDCPQLQMRLPRRKEMIETPFLGEVAEEVERALYEAIRAGDGEAGVDNATRLRAARLGVELPEAQPLLEPLWPVRSAHGEAADESAERRRTVPDDALIIDCANPVAHAVGNALHAAGLSERCFQPDPRCEGMTWYDRLPKLENPEFRIQDGDGTHRLGEGTGPWNDGRDRKVDAIELRLRTAGGGPRYAIGAGVAWVSPGVGCKQSEVQLFVAKDGRLRPDAIGAIVTDAHATSEGGGDAELEEWCRTMTRRARTVLVSETEGIRSAVEDAFERHVLQYVGQAESVTVRYEPGTGVRVEVAG